MELERREQEGRRRKGVRGEVRKGGSESVGNEDKPLTSCDK